MLTFEDKSICAQRNERLCGSRNWFKVRGEELAPREELRSSLDAALKRADVRQQIRIDIKPQLRHESVDVGNQVIGVQEGYVWVPDSFDYVRPG